MWKFLCIRALNKYLNLDSSALFLSHKSDDIDGLCRKTRTILEKR